MNFDFSEEQYMLRDNVKTFLDGEWNVAKVRAAADTKGFDKRLWAQLTELGLPALLVPEEHGGLGMTFLDLVLIIEEFGRALVPAAMIETILGGDFIARFGNDSHCNKILPKVADGSAILAFAFYEPGAGYDLDQMQLSAEARDGDGKQWHLSGTKILVPFADIATHLIVLARESSGRLGMFVCDAQQSGIAITPHKVNDPGGHACEVRFDVDLNAEDRIAGNADAAAAQMLTLHAAAATAEMVGAASRAFDIALEYAKLREQFGQVIGAFQAIKHKFSDMYTGLEAGRSALYYAAWAIAENDDGLDKAVSTAKAFFGDACRLILNESLQVHGGIGYTWQYDLHYFLKRIKALEYSYGDSTWHRERVLQAALAEAT